MLEPKATRVAYGEALLEMGKKNTDIVVLDADLSESTKTNVFADAYPERFFDVGCAEQNLIGVAAGLAASGKIPFASTYAVFASCRAYEQIRNTVAFDNLNVNIAVSHAGLTNSADGGTHQSVEDIALMRVLPNMTVIVPADAIEAYKAVEAAAKHDGPVYIRLNRVNTPILFDDSYDFSIGNGVKMKDGSDVTIIATGTMVSESLEAAEGLSGEGIDAEVINIHTIKPVDSKIILGSARKTGCIVTAEEHSIIGGLGGAVAEVIAENEPVPIKRVGIGDVFGESGNYNELLEKFGCTKEHIVGAAKEVLKKRR
jgi:transketolase